MTSNEKAAIGKAFNSARRELATSQTDMVALLAPETEILAGLELGGVPIATAISLETGIPAAFVREKAQEYGTCLSVEGGGVRGNRVVLIEDVITTGGAVAEAARKSERQAVTCWELAALFGAAVMSPGSQLAGAPGVSSYDKCVISAPECLQWVESRH